MPKPLVLLALWLAGGAASADETSVYGGVERGHGSISITSERSLAGAIVQVRPMGAPADIQIGRVSPVLGDFFGAVGGLDLSIGTVYSVTIFYAKGPFEHLRFAAYGAGDCLAPNPSTGPELQAVLLRNRAPRWAQPPVVDGVRPVAALPGSVVGAPPPLTITGGPVEPGTLLSVKISDPGGRMLWTGVGSASNRGPTVLCPQDTSLWPNRVIAEISLVDLADRHSDTVRVDVEVLRSPAPELLSLAEKLLVFGAVPFLVGYVVGGRLTGRRSTARRC